MFMISNKFAFIALDVNVSALNSTNPALTHTVGLPYRLFSVLLFGVGKERR